MLLFDNLSRLEFNITTQELSVSLPSHLSKNLDDLDVQPFNFQSEEFTQSFNSAKKSLLLSLAFIDLGILAISTFLAYILAGKTLAPIEKSLKAQKRFTADAAHELRTPLTAIKTTLEVNLKDKKINKEQAISILKDNLKDIEGLEKLSNDLLLLSKTENHRQMLNYQSIALDELSDELINKFKAIAKNKNIKIIGNARHVLFKTDYDKLLQLLSIFLDNAIKYTPKDGKISLIFFMEKKKAVFQIKDSGVGISKEKLPLIFDRFYKIEASRNKNESKGFGLGLSIASEIADLLNGELSVASQLGKGSTFCLRLS
jgi:signal transduction histidine kinase